MSKTIEQKFYIPVGCDTVECGDTSYIKQCKACTGGVQSEDISIKINYLDTLRTNMGRKVGVYETSPLVPMLVALHITWALK